MSEFRTVEGFEDVWRPPVRPRWVRPELHEEPRASDVRARLARIVKRAPEVMVKVTGRTRDPAHLAAHLTYITRNGELDAEDRNGLSVMGRREVLNLAADWSSADLIDSRRRTNSAFSISIILSMPAETDALRLRDAARAFALESLGDRFEYVFALHTDTAHPHVHLAVRALSEDGGRLNPKKADLEAWRQTFARTLRERGVEAEATPRRARGVTRKPERAPIRRLRERYEGGRGPLGRTAASKVREAAQLAFGGPVQPTPWEQHVLRAQARVRRLYLAQAKLLQASSYPEDRQLGAQAEVFVREMPRPDTERLALARELRAANARLRDSGATRPLDLPEDRRRGR